MIILKYIFILMLVVSGVNSMNWYNTWETRKLWHPPEERKRYNQGYYRNQTITYMVPGYWYKSKTQCTLTQDAIGNITVDLGYVQQSSLLCGLYGCELLGKNAYSFFFLCQKPAIFAECETQGVDTTVDFPECCWKCVEFKNVSSKLQQKWLKVKHWSQKSLS